MCHFVYNVTLIILGVLYIASNYLKHR